MRMLSGSRFKQFRFVQIPHHGSRRNVGPSVLTRLLGEKQLESDASRFSAFVSAPADDETHPRRIVLNAFKRRGGKIIATQGTNKIYYGGFPKREDTARRRSCRSIRRSRSTRDEGRAGEIA